VNPDYQHLYVQAMEGYFAFGLVVASALMIYFYRRKSIFWIPLLPLFVLFAHEVDEYLLSPALFGPEGHFLNWAYSVGLVISPIDVVVINLGSAVLAASIFFFKQGTKLFAGVFLFMSSAQLANAALHLGVATLQSAYSPGMITALGLFLPMFVFAILQAQRESLSSKAMFALSIIAFIVHFMMILRINAG